jgi:hypothetical protein
VRFCPSLKTIWCQSKRTYKVKRVALETASEGLLTLPCSPTPSVPTPQASGCLAGCWALPRGSIGDSSGVSSGVTWYRKKAPFLAGCCIPERREDSLKTRPGVALARPCVCHLFSSIPPEGRLKMRRGLSLWQVASAPRFARVHEALVLSLGWRWE